MAGPGPWALPLYPVETLEAAFAGLDQEQAGRDALALEQALRPHRLDAQAAWDLHRQGRRIGHTVAVLLSEPKP
jgi:hypothetical protein